MPNDPAADQVFEFLDQTHRTIALKLADLQALVQALQAGPWNARQADAVQLICHYFSTEARQHHLDEELHILPALLASPEAQVRELAAQIQQDHGWLERAWLEFEPLLQAAAQQQGWAEPEQIAQHFDLLLQLHREHMALEESVAYPEARASGRAWDVRGIGREMARRRAQLEREQASGPPR